jgi:hypothetical protein
MKLKPIIVVIPQESSSYYASGEANGYVIVDKDHPWYEKNYDDITVNVHGGLTYSDEVVFFGMKMWMVGFDTKHLGDTANQWNIKAVFNEAVRLWEKAIIVNPVENDG